ncbi:MAG TPA: MFS transporter [Acetobacteraceae bacterium]|nr:MFS transporter [Acetobacteraceae bacterium]
MTDARGQRASAARSLGAMPIWPLAATLAVQTLATAALFSVPTAAPEIAHDLNVPGPLVGVFVSAVYGVGIISALLAPGFIWRYGAVRVSQMVLLGVAGMLAIAAGGGTVAMLGLAAVTLGLGYGAAAPASTHLLVPQTPRTVFNLVMSIRQIGVPLGGVLGALIVPPLTLALGWRPALLIELGPVLALLAIMELPRRGWDVGRDPTRPLLGGALLEPFRLLRYDHRLRALSLASFFYSGVQLCFIAFMTVQLTTVARFSLVDAGGVLAAYQIAGAVSRPIWGWMADRILPPSRMLALHGLGMASACIAAGRLGPSWPAAAVMVVGVLAGATASGYTGVAYAEYARLGGRRRTEATGLGTAAMFSGVMLIPSAFGIAVTRLGGYTLPYVALAAAAAASAAVLWSEPKKGRSGG